LQVVAEGTGQSDRIYYTNSESVIGGIICRDNVIGKTPHIVRHETLLLKAERDPTVFSDKAEILGPSEIVKNRVGDTTVASGDIER